MKKLSFYFGCLEDKGHFFYYNPHGHWKRSPKFEELPGGFLRSWWNLVDSGLLKNGKHPDVYDGKVFWTVGKQMVPSEPKISVVFDPEKDYKTATISEVPWHAFYWWDNSVDTRPGSNAALYVKGFEYPSVQAAWEFGLAQWPHILKQAKVPLVVQSSRIEKPFP